MSLCMGLDAVAAARSEVRVWGSQPARGEGDQEAATGPGCGTLLWRAGAPKPAGFRTVLGWVCPAAAGPFPWGCGRWAGSLPAPGMASFCAMRLDADPRWPVLGTAVEQPK